MTFSELYVGSFRTLKQVDAVGSLSPSLRMATLWIVNGGVSVPNPKGGGRSQDVTKRSKLACCSLFMLAKTLQKRETLLSKPVNPPA